MGMMNCKRQPPDVIGMMTCMRQPPHVAVTCRPEPVRLQVYDLGPFGDVKSLNPMLRAAGVGGAYHVGVEVYGREWSFYRRGNGHLPGGVLACRPRCNTQHVYRESLHM